MMAPKQGDTPRRRYTSLIEENLDHVNSIKCMGCWRYCKNIECHHLEVSRDFVKNYSEGKTKVGPLEINLNVDIFIEATLIPITRELWFKARQLEKGDRCQYMLKPEHQGANLVKDIPRNWLLEAYDKLLLIIQRFFYL